VNIFTATKGFCRFGRVTVDISGAQSKKSKPPGVRAFLPTVMQKNGVFAKRQGTKSAMDMIIHLVRPYVLLTGAIFRSCQVLEGSCVSKFRGAPFSKGSHAPSRSFSDRAASVFCVAM